MKIKKKQLLLSALSVIAILGWVMLKPELKPTNEIGNIFTSSIYTQYNDGIKNFVLGHPLYEKVKKSAETPYNTKVKSIIEEIEKKPIFPEEQRTSHESLIAKIRESLSTSQTGTSEEQESKNILEDLINWLFLEADFKAEIALFFHSYVIPFSENSDFLAYLQNTQEILSHHPKFKGQKEKPSNEDQLFQGNLPSLVTVINEKTKLIRMGQPVVQSFYAFRWPSFWQASPEFLFFLQKQERHLYVNLMKRKGIEKPMTSALESLQERFDNLYLVTLDKNSSFYWQEGREYPEIMNSIEFKQIFLCKMFLPRGDYFWTKHLDPALWKEKLEGMIHEIHKYYFKSSKFLNREERQDFIELTYVAILNHLVKRWVPTSMNITCRQGIDRSPSLMALWLLEQEAVAEGEISVLLLGPPLVAHNRASHLPRIKRFTSAAKRIFARKTN